MTSPAEAKARSENKAGAENKVCAVVGAGPGNGLAFARRFASGGYRVALMARSADALAAMAKDVRGSRSYAADVHNPASLEATFAAVVRDLGPVDVLIYNAGSGMRGSIEDVAPDAFETAWRTNVLGLVHAAKFVLPAMKAIGGAIVVIGATASLRGGAAFAAFAQAKAAQRSLAQSMARQLAPQGVHVSYVVIDGVIDTARARAMDAFKSRHDSFFLKPDDIAESVWFLAHQPHSAWTFELDVRPFGETW